MKSSEIIHIARVHLDEGKRYLYLKEIEAGYGWFYEEGPALLEAPTIEEAISLASRHFKHHFFDFLNCGFRFQVTPRDEHGAPAFFRDMVASFSTPTGEYYDESKGHHYIVNNPSREALDFLKRLRSST